MKKVFDPITRVTDKLCYYISFFSMAVAVFMALMLTVDVILRKLPFGWTVPGAYEITQVFLSTFVFSSWAYTQTVHGHIHVVMFIQKMPQKLRFFCYGLTSLLSVATMIFAAYAVYFQIFAVKKSGESTANLLIPYWPFYIFEFAAFVMLAIVLLRDAIKAVCAIFSAELAEEIQTDWT